MKKSHRDTTTLHLQPRQRPLHAKGVHLRPTQASALERSIDLRSSGAHSLKSKPRSRTSLQTPRHTRSLARSFLALFLVSLMTFNPVAVVFAAEEESTETKEGAIVKEEVIEQEKERPDSGVYVAEPEGASTESAESDENETNEEESAQDDGSTTAQSSSEASEVTDAESIDVPATGESDNNPEKTLEKEDVGDDPTNSNSDNEDLFTEGGVATSAPEIGSDVTKDVDESKDSEASDHATSSTEVRFASSTSSTTDTNITGNEEGQDDNDKTSSTTNMIGGAIDSNSEQASTTSAASSSDDSNTTETTSSSSGGGGATSKADELHQESQEQAGEQAAQDDSANQDNLADQQELVVDQNEGENGGDPANNPTTTVDEEVLRAEIEQVVEDRLKKEYEQKLQQLLKERSAGKVTISNFQSEQGFNDNDCELLSNNEIYCRKGNVATENTQSVFTGVFENEDSTGSEIILQIGGSVTQITDNDYDDINPVYDEQTGLVVWQALIDGRWQIIAYDVESARTTQVTGGGYNNINPHTFGGVIVWQGWAGSNWDVFYAQQFENEDGSTHWETVRVTDNKWPDVEPHIAEGMILWEALIDGSWQVFSYDVYTSNLVQVSQGGGNNRNPRLMLLYESEEGSSTQLVGFDVASQKHEVIDDGKDEPKPLSEEIPDNPINENQAAFPGSENTSSSSGRVAAKNESD